jgi:predicted transcriptional regulator
MKDKRSKLQIYYDIFDAIIKDKQDHEEISKTRIQFKSNTSYDKLLRYLDEMDQKGIIKKGKQIEVTDIGMQFYDDYSKLLRYLDEMDQKGIIKKGKQIEVTDIGMQFYDDYSRVNNLINEITQRLS